MKEKNFIKIINDTLNSKYIGDDCAFLSDLGIVVTQDSLVEGVHFDLSFITPYQLGYKSVMVNISDVCASGAVAKYLTISLSLPENVDEEFVKAFYEGAKSACSGAEIVGGDLTKSEKIFVSVTAIGATGEREISSRSYAKAGQKIIVSGEHGNSALGLRILQNKQGREIFKNSQKFIDAHLMPKACVDFSKQIGTFVKAPYAMMDSSDGLVDTLTQISYASNVSMVVDFEKIPFDGELLKVYDYKDLIFYGGEDYELIATVDEEFLPMLQDFYVIGEVVEQNEEFLLDISGKKLNLGDVDKKIYKHFQGEI